MLAKVPQYFLKTEADYIATLRAIGFIPTGPFLPSPPLHFPLLSLSLTLPSRYSSLPLEVGPLKYS